MKRKHRASWEQTATPVGSPERVEVYRRRAAAGLPVFHPGDTRQRVWLDKNGARHRSLARNPRSKDPRLPPGVTLIRGRRKCYRARVRTGPRGSAGIALGYYLTLAEAVAAILSWHREHDGHDLAS